MRWYSVVSVPTPGCCNSTVMYHPSEYIRPVVNEPNSLTPPRSETLSERGAFDRDHQSRTRLREWSSTTITRWTTSFALARARAILFSKVSGFARARIAEFSLSNLPAEEYFAGRRVIRSSRFANFAAIIRVERYYVKAFASLRVA